MGNDERLTGAGGANGRGVRAPRAARAATGGGAGALLLVLSTGCSGLSTSPATIVVTAPPAVTVTFAPTQSATPTPTRSTTVPVKTVTKTVKPTSPKTDTGDTTEGNWKTCGDQVTVEPRTTTCAFALDVASNARYNEYFNGYVYSSTTGTSYWTSCSPRSRWIECDTGRGGHVTVRAYY